MRKSALALLAFLVIAGLPEAVQAQGVPGSATVVSACGTPPSTYTPGQNRAILQDSNGRGCSDSTVTIPGTVSVQPLNPIGLALTDHSISSASGSSETVMAANASRHSLTIQNTGNANCGVNPTGGTASIGGAGTITLYPGGAYSPRVPSVSAITAICTSGQPLYADEN